MISIKESLLSKELGKTRISLRGNRGRRGTCHPFSGIILKESQCLESPRWLK
jgi:hypothetical protein